MEPIGTWTSTALFAILSFQSFLQAKGKRIVIEVRSAHDMSGNNPSKGSDKHYLFPFNILLPVLHMQVHPHFNLLTTLILYHKFKEFQVTLKLTL